ncbi:MAG: S-adenosylmethionine:tRNA ribosyltransferase-isomerase, partial [Clostridiales bacterium]|nr:S-adenosylmethionine:tRNA ribosyltransferase-isomerase [Clostridiales bacterium]
MTGTSLSDYDYVLPPGLIAQEPPENRLDSRLMLLDKATGETAD